MMDTGIAEICATNLLNTCTLYAYRYKCGTQKQGWYTNNITVDAFHALSFNIGSGQHRPKEGSILIGLVDSRVISIQRPIQSTLLRAAERHLYDGIYLLGIAWFELKARKTVDASLRRQDWFFDWLVQNKLRISKQRMNREVSHYVVTAHPPNGILHTVKCNFLAEDSEVSKGIHRTASYRIVFSYIHPFKTHVHWYTSIICFRIL